MSITVSEDVITGRTWHASNDWVAETYPDSSVIRSGGGLTVTLSDPALFRFAGIQLAPDERIANAVLRFQYIPSQQSAVTFEPTRGLPKPNPGNPVSIPIQLGGQIISTFSPGCIVGPLHSACGLHDVQNLNQLGFIEDLQSGLPFVVSLDWAYVLSFGVTSPGYNFAASYEGGGLNYQVASVELDLVTVPEPATLALLCTGVAEIARRLRLARGRR